MKKKLPSTPPRGNKNPFAGDLSPIAKKGGYRDINSDYEDSDSDLESSVYYSESEDSEPDYTESADELSSNGSVKSVTQKLADTSLLESDQDFSLGSWFNRTANSHETSLAMQKLKLSKDSSVIWTKDLDLKYQDKSFEETAIPADEYHAQLTSSGNKIKNTVSSKFTKDSQTDSYGDPKPNFLMVNIGYILSNPAKNGEKFVSFPVRIMGENFYSVQTSWESNGTSKDDSVDNLQERHDCGYDHSPQMKGFSEVQKNGPSHYAHDVKGPTYETKFHHSEQALYEYLTQKKVIKQLLERIKQAGVPAGTEIQGIVIDMHSTRYVCGNCELGAMGMMSPEYKFLERFKKQAEKFGYSYKPDDTELAFRVTANRPDGKGQEMSARNHKLAPEARILGHRPEDLRNKTIYERDVDARPLEEVETDLHRRTAFISSYVSGDKKYTDSYDQVVVGEYTAMIADGRKGRVYTDTVRNLDREFQLEEAGLLKKFAGKTVIKEEREIGEDALSPEQQQSELEGFKELARLSLIRNKSFVKDKEIIEQAKKLHTKRIKHEKEIVEERNR